MYVDNSDMRAALLRLIRPITADCALRDDLAQESLVHLWLMETNRPGQTQSWYLQSCRFHLLHYLASGRSIDSPKRRALRFESDPEAESAFEQCVSGESVFASVSVRDILSV